MTHIIEIWDLIVKSNAFNFVVMIIILGWLLKKANLTSALENLKSKVIEQIEKAKSEKENAKNDLLKAKKSVANLDTEIKERILSAEEQAKTVAKRILDETESKIQQIESNVKRAVESEEKTVSSKLTSKTVNASVQLAKNHIKSLLQDHPELHKQYINESIENLDKVKF